MFRSRRSPRLPSDLAAHLPPGDKPMAAAELADGSWAVVATGALLLIGEEGLIGRHPWHDIEHGSWDGDTRELTITWVEGARQPLVLVAASDAVAEFTAALRERVQSSVVHEESRDLPGGAVARVIIRRDGQGALFSQLTAYGVLRGDEAEQALIDDLERRARAAAGLAT